MLARREHAKTLHTGCSRDPNPTNPDSNHQATMLPFFVYQTKTPTQPCQKLKMEFIQVSWFRTGFRDTDTPLLDEETECHRMVGRETELPREFLVRSPFASSSTTLFHTLSRSDCSLSSVVPLFSPCQTCAKISELEHPKRFSVGVKSGENTKRTGSFRLARIYVCVEVWLDVRLGASSC